MSYKFNKHHQAEIKEFTSISEFKEFEKYIFDLVKNDDLLEIPVETHYFGIFPEKWYLDKESNQKWRLVYPDFPFKGLWAKLEAVNEISNMANKISKLKQLGFEINWQLIKIGYYGDEFLPKQLSKQDIIEYTTSLIEFNDQAFPETIDLLIFENDDTMFEEALTKLANKENRNIDLQKRKWIVQIIKDMIQNIKLDYTEGLLELTDVWVSLGLPENAPHIIQGADNSLTVKEYYTKEVFEKLINKHIEWIQNEILQINSNEAIESK